MKKPVILAVSVVFGLIPALASGSGAGAVIEQFNTSARAAGMGRAGVGLVWGQDTNHWANPALLAFRQGVHYLHFSSQLAVGLADDIQLTRDEVTVGAYGLTVSLALSPLDGTYLDMGEQVLMDEGGQEVATFHPWEKTTSWAIGADIVHLLDLGFGGAGNGSPGISRFASLAVGYAGKSYEDQLAGERFLQVPGGSGSASADMNDKGWVAALTPVNTAAGGGFLANGLFDLKIGGAYGRSTLSDGKEFLHYVNEDQPDPTPRRKLSGWSLRAEVSLARDRWSPSGSEFMDLLYESFNPLLSFTRVRQRILPGYDYRDGEWVFEENEDEVEWGKGWEVGIFNVFYLRKGYVQALWGAVDAPTEGWGINLQGGALGGFRYDHSTTPQARGLPTVDQESWAVWIDPLAIAAR